MTEYTWRVMKDNRFAGYVVAASQLDALRRAEEYYGKNIWIERIFSKAVS